MKSLTDSVSTFAIVLQSVRIKRNFMRSMQVSCLDRLNVMQQEEILPLYHAV